MHIKTKHPAIKYDSRYQIQARNAIAVLNKKRSSDEDDDDFDDDLDLTIEAKSNEMKQTRILTPSPIIVIPDTINHVMYNPHMNNECMMYYPQVIAPCAIKNNNVAPKNNIMSVNSLIN